MTADIGCRGARLLVHPSAIAPLDLALPVRRVLPMMSAGEILVVSVRLTKQQIEAAPMGQRPVAAPAVYPAVPEQEGEELLALSPKIVSRLAGARKIAHRLMSRVGRPNSGQLARLMHTRQRNRIPPVRLDPLARSFRGSALERPPCNHARAPAPGDEARIPSVQPRSRGAAGRIAPPVS